MDFSYSPSKLFFISMLAFELHGSNDFPVSRYLANWLLSQIVLGNDNHS